MLSPSRMEPEEPDLGGAGSFAPRLLDRLRQRDEHALGELLTSVGRRLVGIAYAILQEREAAGRAAAAAVADAWRLPSAEWPGEPETLAEDLFIRTARKALDLHVVAREVDAEPRRGAELLLRHRPGVRAVAALQLIGGLDPGAAIAGPRLGWADARAARRALADGERQRSMHEALAANVAGLPVPLSAADVQRALIDPPPRPPAAWRRAIGPAAAIAGAALLGVTLLVTPLADRPTPKQRPSTPATTRPSDTPDAVSEPLAAVPALAATPTLADCGIRPLDAPLAFDGWTTPAQLGSSVAMLVSSQPVYAQVPRDLVIWDPRGDAAVGSMPPERLACLTDGARRLHVVVRLPEDWAPASLVDGCPATQVQPVAGLRSLSGDAAPGPGTTWWSDDPSTIVLARVAPPPGTATVSAWAQPLGVGAPILLEIEDSSIAGRGIRATTYYLWLRGIRFYESPCWVLSIVVGGRVAGSTIIASPTVSGRLP